MSSESVEQKDMYGYELVK